MGQPKTDMALDISFGSSGYALVLARAFKKVSSVLLWERMSIGEWGTDVVILIADQISLFQLFMGMWVKVFSG